MEVLTAVEGGKNPVSLSLMRYQKHLSINQIRLAAESGTATPRTDLVVSAEAAVRGKPTASSFTPPSSPDAPPKCANSHTDHPADCPNKCMDRLKECQERLWIITLKTVQTVHSQLWECPDHQKEHI